ncbi:MAG TPA: hypothetical protein VH120_00060 [Gemmataceae bacterium]|nr:hypothetical protein [Gemmataceae bacterium]
MQPPTATASPSTGRRLFLFGMLCGIVGLPLYAAQLLATGRTFSPWYAPILATVAVLLIGTSLARGSSRGRIIALLLFAGLAGLEWWFFVSYVRLPAYNGPVVAGQAFPEFRALRADGTAFTRADLPNTTAFFRGPDADVPRDRATALVFFRGRW